jgi:hypothetical protein
MPLKAGDVNDSWSAALAVRGWIDVYLDSLVVRADTVRLRAMRNGAKDQRVDSIVFALAGGAGRSWSVARHGSALQIRRTLAAGADWSRRGVRWMIPIGPDISGLETPSSEEALLRRWWPVFEVVLRVPRTADNPYGVAWTYAHEREGFFASLPRSRPPVELPP